MKVGLLTGGGDCPGLNAVIRAVVQSVANEGGTCVGILEGWRGLVKGMSRALEVSETDGIIARGGTILGSSRTNPFKYAATDIPALRENFQALGLDALQLLELANLHLAGGHIGRGEGIGLQRQLLPAGQQFTRSGEPAPRDLQDRLLAANPPPLLLGALPRLLQLEPAQFQGGLGLGQAAAGGGVFEVEEHRPLRDHLVLAYQHLGDPPRLKWVQ